jgi:hypothetical protein
MPGGYCLNDSFPFIRLFYSCVDEYLHPMFVKWKRGLTKFLFVVSKPEVPYP